MSETKLLTWCPEDNFVTYGGCKWLIPEGLTEDYLHFYRILLQTFMGDTGPIEAYNQLLGLYEVKVREYSDE